MKRGIIIAGALLLAVALSGLCLSLTLTADTLMRDSLARGMLWAASAGLLLAAVLWPRARRAGALNVLRGENTQGAASVCRFSDVAANAQALNSLTELVDYLKAPGKYAAYGARMPKGVMLYGPPGTGKTLMARALAGEAGVPIFALSGSDFVEKYVGVGASRVRELFRKARKAGRCVIFIDEIDAVGKMRGEGASDERDQTLNALLSEMSGFHGGDGIIVLAATNRIETLDPALLRPGRFDRQIEVGLPGRAERLSILKLHSRGKPLSKEVCLEEIAAQTIHFSGASLENLLNEAAMLAARRGLGQIGREDVQAAYLKVAAGEERESVAGPEEKRMIAFHEAGHALATRLMLPEDRLSRVSILPAGRGAAGYNLTVPAEKVMQSRRQLEGQLCVLLAGRAAELLEGGEENVTAGASGDLDRATRLAEAMVVELGLAGEPSISYRALSTGGVNRIDAIRDLLQRQFERIYTLLSRHRGALRTLAEALIESEALEGARAETLIDAALSNESQKSA